jgi:hypothetical protein
MLFDLAILLRIWATQNVRSMGASFFILSLKTWFSGADQKQLPLAAKAVSLKVTKV